MPYDGLRAVMKEPWQVMVGFTALGVRDEAKRSLNTWMTGGSTASSAARPGHRAQDLAGTGRPGRRRAIVTQSMEGNDAHLAGNRTLGSGRRSGCGT